MHCAVLYCQRTAYKFTVYFVTAQVYALLHYTAIGHHLSYALAAAVLVVSIAAAQFCVVYSAVVDSVAMYSAVAVQRLYGFFIFCLRELWNPLRGAGGGGFGGGYKAVTPMG